MGLGVDLMPTLVDVDFLLPKMERQTTAAKGLGTHAQNPGIEILAGIDVAGRQYQVVKMIDQSTGSSEWHGCSGRAGYPLCLRRQSVGGQVEVGQLANDLVGMGVLTVGHGFVRHGDSGHVRRFGGGDAEG